MEIGMADLIFKYGVMGSAKTAQALTTAYNYEERGQKVLLCKPSIDVRDGQNVIASRIGLKRDCIALSELCEMSFVDIAAYNIIIVDEVQFATKEQVVFLSEIVDKLDIPVITYGLKTDFRNELFEGSTAILSIADKIEEVRAVCWCGRDAKCNARYNEKGIVRVGEQVMLGANDKYISLCRKHFNEGNFGNLLSKKGQ